MESIHACKRRLVCVNHVFRLIPAVVQRNGLGRGVFQIDLGAHPGVTAAQAFDPGYSANYAANLLSTNRDRLETQHPNLNPEQLTQATAASDNLGLGQISGNPNTIDVGSAPGGIMETMKATLLQSPSFVFRRWYSAGGRVKKSMLLWAVLEISVLARTNAMMAQAGLNGVLIQPGIGVAELKLGSDASAFEAVSPKRPGSSNSAQSGTVGEGCPDKVYYWNDLEVHTSKVDAYFKGDEVSQLSVFGPKFTLSNGLRTGETEQSVERAYPHGHEYVLLYSASKVNGGRDVHYWVDKEAGIAFELDWWQNKKRRFVGSVDIFPKGADYKPDGCIRGRPCRIRL